MQRENIGSQFVKLLFVLAPVMDLTGKRLQGEGAVTKQRSARKVREGERDP